LAALFAQSCARIGSGKASMTLWSHGACAGFENRGHCEASPHKPGFIVELERLSVEVARADRCHESIDAQPGAIATDYVIPWMT
jgi:hypothetical protein